MTETRFCPQCGKSVSATDRFCGACGASLTPGAMPAPQPTKPEAPARRGRRVVAASLVGAALILGVATFAIFGFAVATSPSQAESHLPGPGEAGSAPATDTPVPPANIPGDAAFALDPTVAVMDLDVIAWHFSPAEPDFIDMPTLMSELDYDPANDLTQLSFVCQSDREAPIFYVLLVAPSFTEAESVDIAIGDTSSEPLYLRLGDLYASGASAPAIDWDARILFAEIDQMALAPLFEAPSLTVVSGARAWRMGTTDMGEAASAFLGACWGDK